MGAFRARRYDTHQVDFLPPDPVPARAKTRFVTAVQDVEDAEFVVMGNDGPRRPFSVFNDNAASAPNAVKQTLLIRLVKAIASPFAYLEKQLQQFSQATFAGIAVLAFVTIFWAVGSLTIARALPHFTPEPVPPLVISKINISVHKSNGIPLLEVSAMIRNQSDQPQILPNIRLELVPGVSSGAPLMITPLATSLNPGESTGFSARYPYSGGKLPEARLAFDTKGAPAR